MSFNGSGTFLINSTGQPVVPNTTISSTVFNALTADLATGLSTCLTIDGQSTVTANIPFGGFNIVSVGRLGIGTATPGSVIDVMAATNTNSIISLQNSGAFAGTSALFQLKNGTHTGQMAMLGTSFTSAGINRQDGLIISTNGAGGVTINTGAAQPIYFGYNSAEIVRFDGSNFLWGMTAAGTSAVGAFVIKDGIAPSTSPAGGGQLYVEAGALKYRGSSGTVTTLAPA